MSRCRRAPAGTRSRTRSAARRPPPAPARTASGAAPSSVAGLDVEAALHRAVAVSHLQEVVRDLLELEALVALDHVDPLRRAPLDERRPGCRPLLLARNDRADQVELLARAHLVEDRHEVVLRARP